MKKEENILAESYSPLSEADYDALRARGATDEEIEILKDAFALSATVDALPKNPAKFFEKLNKYFPEDPKAALEKVFKLPEEDPAFFAEIMAYSEVLKALKQPAAQASSVEKVSLEEVDSFKQEEQKADDEAKFMEFINALKALTPEEKAQVSKMFDEKK